jgi:hypothetical protein
LPTPNQGSSPNLCSLLDNIVVFALNQYINTVNSGIVFFINTVFIGNLFLLKEIYMVMEILSSIDFGVSLLGDILC